MSGIGDPCAGIGIAEPCPEMRDKAVGAGNRLRAMGVVQGSVDFRKVPDVRTVQNRRAELGGLDRILPAVFNERPTDEDCRCHAVEEAELADGVGDIDLGVAVWHFPARAHRHRQAGGGGDFDNACAAFRMTRSDEGQQARKIGAQPGVSFKDGALLAGVS